MTMRINKLLAKQCGVGRRKADTWIAEGRVLINGTVAAMGDKARIGDAITVDGQVLDWTPATQIENVYIMYNKPAGVECTFDSSQAGAIQGKTRRDLSAWLQQYPAIRYAGRLDVNSEGLLLLSTDGAWINQITHPSFSCVKTYTVRTHLLSEIPGQRTKTIYSDELGWVQTGVWELDAEDDNIQWWTVKLEQGMNRQIRRIAQHFGGNVVKLRRICVGPYELGTLRSGASLQLDPILARTRLAEYLANK